MSVDPYKQYRDMMSVSTSPPLTRGRVDAVARAQRAEAAAHRAALLGWDAGVQRPGDHPGAFAHVPLRMKTKFEVAVDAQLKRIRDSLVAKNVAYGNSALEPVRIFSDADPLEQLNVRIDDKISRMKSGLPDDEDAAWDLLGYLVLREVAKGWKA